MEIPPGIRQQIQEFRHDNPSLSVHMSDAEISEIFQQADQAIANDRPAYLLESIFSGVHP